MHPTYFEDLPLSENVLDALYDMKFTTCTPIQEKCITPIIDRRDIIGIAQTGTGKTAAYLLPLLTLLEELPPQSPQHPQCLIMAPTRELAQQIDQALQGFGYYTNISGIAIYGGNDAARYEQERRSLQQGAQILIATPGRLLSHINLGTCNLSQTKHFVLDEADRMLDMGFSDDILKIASQLPAERQTILFSATMPSRIRQLARSLMHHPLEVRLSPSKPAEGISQSIYICKEDDKKRVVHHLFTPHPPTRAIIFCSTKQKTRHIAAQLQQQGYNVEAIHSDLTQPERQQVMQHFRTRHTHILVATDLLARGIDIDDISLILNYDVPHDAEDYVHRVGRTARAGKQGRAVTLVSPSEQPQLQHIEQMLQQKIPRSHLPFTLEESENREPRNTPPRQPRGKKNRANHRPKNSILRKEKPTK